MSLGLIASPAPPIGAVLGIASVTGVVVAVVAFKGFEQAQLLLKVTIACSCWQKHLQARGSNHGFCADMLTNHLFFCIKMSHMCCHDSFQKRSVDIIALNFNCMMTFMLKYMRN